MKSCLIYNTVTKFRGVNNEMKLAFKIYVGLKLTTIIHAPP